MTTLTGIAVVRDGRLVIDLSTSLLAGEIDVQIVLSPIARSDVPDLTDIVGKLKWQGDAVAEQRRLRNEWPD